MKQKNQKIIIALSVLVILIVAFAFVITQAQDAKEQASCTTSCDSGLRYNETSGEFLDDPLDTAVAEVT